MPLTCNNTPNKHLSETKGSDLKDGTYAHDSCADEDRLLAAKNFAQPAGRNGSDKTSNIVDGSHSTWDGVSQRVQWKGTSMRVSLTQRGRLGRTN